MPRVENLGPEVRGWNTATGNGASDWDLCQTCWGLLNCHPHGYDKVLRPYNGDPPGSEGRGGDVEHPPYEELGKLCAVCGHELSEEDD